MGARPNIILCGGELKRGGGKEKGEREVCLPPKKVLRFYTMKVPLGCHFVEFSTLVLYLVGPTF
jgi:hypothetical protein